MLARADKIKILAFDFIHHGVHFGKAHNARYNIASYHKRRNAVSKASVNHKIPCVRDNGRMNSGNIAHEIIESVARNTSCGVKVNAVETLHNIGVVRNFKIGNNRLAVFCDLNILAVILADGDARVNDIGNDHHYFCYLFGIFCLKLFALGKSLRKLGDL